MATTRKKGQEHNGRCGSGGGGDFETGDLPNLHPGPVLGGAGPDLEQFRSAQVPSQLAPRSVDLGAGPIGSNYSNWLKSGPASIIQRQSEDSY